MILGNSDGGGVTAPAAVAGLDAIRALPVLGPNGEKLNLGSLARVDVAPGFARIFREHGFGFFLNHAFT